MSLDLPPVPAPFRLTLGTVMLAVITLGTVMLAVIAAAALLALGTRTEELLGPRGNRTERSDTVAVVLLGVVLSAVAVGLWRRFSARQVLAMISVCCGLMLIYIEAVIADLTRTTHYTESSRGPTHGGGVGPTSVGPVTPQGFWVSGPTEVGPTGLASARDPGDPVLLAPGVFALTVVAPLAIRRLSARLTTDPARLHRWENAATVLLGCALTLLLVGLGLYVESNLFG